MIFGKYLNRFYVKYGLMLLLGLLSLIAVDYLQLVIPGLYQMLINGVNSGFVTVDGAAVPFDMDFLLQRICMPMVSIILAVVVGRFIWRIMFIGCVCTKQSYAMSPMCRRPV